MTSKKTRDLFGGLFITVFVGTFCWAAAKGCVDMHRDYYAPSPPVHTETSDRTVTFRTTSALYGSNDAIDLLRGAVIDWESSNGKTLDWSNVTVTFTFKVPPGSK